MTRLRAWWREEGALKLALLVGLMGVAGVIVAAMVCLYCIGGGG